MNSKFHFGLLESFLAVVIVLSVVPVIVVLSNSIRVDEDELYQDGQDSVTIEEIDYDHGFNVIIATASNGETYESETAYENVQSDVEVNEWDVDHEDGEISIWLTSGKFFTTIPYTTKCIRKVTMTDTLKVKRTQNPNKWT